MKKMILNILLYFAILALFITTPLLIIHLIFPKEKNLETWFSFIGSYLGSVIAIIGTLIITRIQIRSERLDSLNNSLFIENHQILNSLLNDLYHTKNLVSESGWNLKIIHQSLIKNNNFNKANNYFQQWNNNFDINQFTSFYNFAKNRLMAMKLNQKETNQVESIIANLFMNNRALSMTLRDLSIGFNKKSNQNTNKQLASTIENAMINLKEIKYLLDQLDMTIQDILQDNMTLIKSK